MMKHSYIILSVTVLLACGSGDRLESIGGSTSLDYSLDTVMIDPGEEILFVSGRLYQSDLSPDHKYLYNFNQHDHTFEQIDLDENKLLRKYPFEKEGPNGIGEYIRSFFLLDNDHLVIYTFPNPAIFDLGGNKIQELNFQGIAKDANGIQEGEFFLVSMVHPGNKDQFLGYVRDFEEGSIELMRVDYDKGLTKRMPIPQFDNLKKFEMQYTDGKGYMMSGPQTFLVKEGGKVFLGSNLKNEFYEYLPESDSLLLRSFISQLTENEKKGTYQNEFDTQEAFVEAMRQVREEINFSPPFWDDLNRVFYRFSHKEIFKDVSTESFQFPNATNAEVFLTIFDENLEMLAESKISGITMPPQKHFAKDGKIWMFVNVEDELGFARISMDLGIQPLPSDGI
jgi:hypothetical protein